MRWPKAIAVRALSLGLLWFALWDGNIYVGRVVIFLAWASLAVLPLLALLAAQSKGLERAAMLRKWYVWPVWFNTLCELVSYCALAACGWWWTAGAYFLSAIGSNIVRGILSQPSKGAV